MAKYWIKLWTEILKDEKVGDLSDTLWRRMVECFLLAGLVDDNGQLPPLSKMAWITHQTPENLRRELEALQNVGIIGQNEGGGYFVTNWAKRQASASAARRMREYRQRQKPERYEERYAERYESVTETSPRSTEVQSTTTTTTAADLLTNYVIKYFSPKNRISADTAGLVQSIIDNHTDADITYAVSEAERKAANTNEPPTLEYITAICDRRKRGEPDQKRTKGNKKNGTPTTERTADPADPDEWERLLKA